ncbi:MAG: hypothetical protein ABEK59_02815, partial [Halobacteria archaeon]
MADQIPQEDYQFPHIRFNEEIVGPPLIRKSYRNTIGIVGPFNRGPELARVTNRNDFVDLYGEDNTAGSLAVQQAMLQNASDFVISRVVPSATVGNGQIALTPSNNTSSIEAEVADASERTSGIEFALNYLSSPLSRAGENLGAAVETPADKTIDISGSSYTVAPFWDSTAKEPVIDGSGR